MNTPKLRDEFVTANGVDGTPLLNLGRIKTWLDDYTDGLLYLMVTASSFETHHAERVVFTTLAVVWLLLSNTRKRVVEMDATLSYLIFPLQSRCHGFFILIVTTSQPCGTITYL